MYQTRPLPEGIFCHSDKLDAWNMAKNTDIVNKMDSKQHMNALRLWKFVGQPIEEYLKKYLSISSGFRNPFVNKLAGGANDSKHLTGCAFDINILGMSAKDLFNTIVLGKIKYQSNPILNYVDEIIFERDLQGNQWVHIQVTDNPRKQMYVKSFTCGKTAYIQVYGQIV